MSTEWNERFSSWAQAPGSTETDKIQHAITAIQKALAGDPTLSALTKVFIQGSYRNRVNVRQDSDVDIGVLYTGNLFGTAYPAGKTDADFGVISVQYGYSHFKNDLETALVNKLGRAAVTRGAKAFDIHENTYRVDADVVPLIAHRSYDNYGMYVCGTELHPDNGGRIINWPERLYATSQWPNQHYENGNQKNTQTARAYRGVVRIIKKLRNIMDGAGIAEAKLLRGFQIECLVWNAPNSCFTNPSWFEDVRAVLNHLSIHLASMSYCGEWREVSERKYLLKNDEARRATFEAFVDRARTLTGIA